MATAIVSGRVDEGVKRAADVHLRRRRLTASDVIAGVWSHIAETGDVPAFLVDEAADGRADAARRLSELRERAPLGTPLASMTDEDIRRELRERD